jgi:uncharacterized protein (TIGR03067 family)
MADKKIDVKGIYEIDGNRLRLCFAVAEATKERPKKLEPGKLVTLFELERTKE